MEKLSSRQSWQLGTSAMGCSCGGSCGDATKNGDEVLLWPGLQSGANAGFFLAPVARRALRAQTGLARVDARVSAGCAAACPDFPTDFSLPPPAGGVSTSGANDILGWGGGLGGWWCHNPCIESQLTERNFKTEACGIFHSGMRSCVQENTGVRREHKLGCVCPNPGDSITDFGAWDCGECKGGIEPQNDNRPPMEWPLDPEPPETGKA